MKLLEAARVIRSKNAGPTTLTVDLMFNERSGYERALAAPDLKPEALSRLYALLPEQVTVIPYPSAFAVKIVMDRKIVAGDPGDRDVYGAQQHGPMLGIDI